MHASAPSKGHHVTLDDVPIPDVPKSGVSDHAPTLEQVWRPRFDHRYRGLRLRVKRLIDVGLALAVGLALLPLMAVIGLGVVVTSRGPAIYRQTRIGRHGEPFTIYKFRTMHREAEARLRADPALHRLYLEGGYKISSREDPRVTALGRFLRRSSLDELPQLLNVLAGQMSLVGPRPVVPEELGQYRGYLAAYLMAVPGLTGAWQVSGRDAVKFPGRAMHDAAYIDRWSLFLDLAIVARTVPAALSARGVE